MDSLEKLHRLLAGTLELEPADEEQAKLIQAVQVAGPMVEQLGLIPGTAEELDALLLGVTGWTIDLRSDDADPAPATELLVRAFGLVKERAGLEEASEPEPSGAPDA